LSIVFIFAETGKTPGGRRATAYQSLCPHLPPTIEQRLVGQPGIKVPAIVLHGEAEGVHPPELSEGQEKLFFHRDFALAAAKDARALRDVVTFHWEMLPADSEKVVVTGLEFLIVDKQGRILIDYQFAKAVVNRSTLNSSARPLLNR
jgi:hypothetical protein